MKKQPLSDLDDEIRDHIERETRDNVDRGMPPDQARYAALRKFGNAAIVQEDARAVWIPLWLDQLGQDARYAWRILVRHPGLSVVAIITLAFGVGVTTAVFSVAYSVLLRPLPYQDSERIVLVRETLRGSAGSASLGHFFDWTEQTNVFDATAAGQPAIYNLADDGDPERVSGMRVTAGYFEVAYLPPAAGRYFTPADFDAGARVAVLGHGLWQRRFAADPAIVGRTIRFGGEPHVVIGVAPAAFALTDPTRASVTGGFSSQVWTPLVVPPDRRTNYGNHAFVVIGKLEPGVPLETAQADLERVTRDIAASHPGNMEGRGVVATSLADLMAGPIATQLAVLFGISAAVLAIGCVNIGSLLLARASARRREIAIRVALGGGHRRLVRQLLTESLVLAVPGGVAAVGVAAAAVRYFVVNGPAAMPRLGDAGLQPAVLAFALAVTLASAVAVGLLPARRAARIDPQAALRDGSRSPLSGRRRDRVRTSMVVAEVAIAVVLLAATGLLLRTAWQVSQVPFGFDAGQVLTARLALPAARYQEDGLVADAYRRMLEPLRGVHGVSHAAVTTAIPLGGGNPDAAVIAEGQVVPAGSEPSPRIRLVSDGYFEAMGMPILRGRPVQPADLAAGAPRVAVINERLAAALWPGDAPLGKRLSTWTAGPEPEWREVVGVVRDARSSGQLDPVPLELFLPYTQAPPGAWNAFQRSMVIVLRSSEGWPDTYVPHLREAVAAVDPTVPLFDVRTMERIVLNLTATRRFYLRLILLLAATGLGLAMLGIYGVVAYFVAERTPEIGLRMAIGARRSEVIGMVIGQGLRLVAAGVAIGLPVAMLVSYSIRTLFLVPPADPLTFASVAVVLAATGLTASVVPSVKAARVDPVDAIRYE